MYKGKTKYTWEGWKSSGREPCVFSVAHPCELMGVHAKLIDKELRPSETIGSCLYAPRVSSTKTPFGLQTDKASYGVCVTNDRFIISKDWHSKESEPVLMVIDLKDVCYLSIGRSLLLGWFSIHYFKDGQLNNKVILFGSIGEHHFERMIRSYKKCCLPFNLDQYNINSSPVSHFIHKIKDNIHCDALKTLVSSGEECLLTFSCRYLCDVIIKKKFLWLEDRLKCHTGRATFLVTNKGLLIARDSPNQSLGNPIDVLCLSFMQIERAILSKDHIGQEVIDKLELRFSTKGETEKLSIALLSLDQDAGSAINNVLFAVNRVQESKVT